ncbi:MAG: hypothetical protein U0361_20255 [Nitrospiraceae bacterium]
MASVYSGLIAAAGWLLSIGQLTIGQFVAAEVVVSGILLSFDGVVKRMGHIYYFLTAMGELNFLFSLPKDQARRLYRFRYRTRRCMVFGSPART